MNDDHGDQFPGAVPAKTLTNGARPTGADERHVRMSAAHTARGRTSPRNHGGRPPTTLARVGMLTRRSLDRFDRYTLDVFNPRPPHALYAPGSDTSA